MAEERIIDDDLNKNKKYKIRKNADGEDELYIDDTVQEDMEEFEAVSFDVPEFAEGGDVLTPEQIAAAEQEKRVRAERISSALSVNIEKAKAKLVEKNFESALQSSDAALQIDPAFGLAWSLKLKALTKDFTDFEHLDECVEVASNVAKYCNEEQKEELAEKSSPLQNKIFGLEEQAAAMHVEVEAKKAERREVFRKKRKKSVAWFSLTCVPFVAFLVLAIVFAITLLDLVHVGGINLTFTIVFAALAAVFFIFTVFTSHKMWESMKKLSLNEKNSSTQLGRDYEKLRLQIKKLNTVLNSFQK